MPHIYTANINNMRIEYMKNEATGATITGVRNAGGNLAVPEELDGLMVTVIGKKAFLGNALIRQVTIPSSVNEIQDYAFAQCTNLKTVFVLNNNVKLGNGVFTECNAVTDICIGYDKTDDLSALLATLIYRLKTEHILVDNIWGSDAWFHKWDMELTTFLRQPDEEGYTDLVLCGEEDIQFSLEEFICNKRKNKSALCLIRLMHNSRLSDETADVLKAYLLKHIKGCASDEAWQALLSEFSEDIAYFKLFAKLGGINADNLDAMLMDMGAVSSEAKVFLMNYKQEKFGNADVFDMFEL